MRILITGGAGFIGGHLAHALVAEGHEVWVLDDLSSGKRENVPKGARFVEGDVRDSELLHEVFEDLLPEAVSHQAAQASVAVSTRRPILDADINLIGTLKLLEECRRHKTARFVFASTGGAIYGEVPEGQRAEVGWPNRPLSPYACSKLAAEGYALAYARAHGMKSTLLRYANVYGPRQDPHGEAGVVAIFSQLLARGEGLRINAMREPGDPGCVRDYVYVGDVVRANVRALGGQLTDEILNVATGVGTTTLRLAQLLAKEAGVEEPALTFAAPRIGDLERSVLLPDPAAIGGEPVSLAEGLQATMAYFKGRA